MKLCQWLLCAALLAVSNLAGAATADLNVNPDVLRASYESLVRRNELSEFAFMMFEGKNPDTDYAVQAGYNVQMNPDLKVGVRGIYVSPGQYDVLAMGIGAKGHFKISPDIGLGGHIYYAPSITSALDATKYFDFGLSIGYFILPRAELYLGYRNMKVTVDDNDRKIKLDDDLHIGFKVDF